MEPFISLFSMKAKNMIRGSHKGFSKVVWKVRKHMHDSPRPYITLTYFIVDGEEGFPSSVLAHVTYCQITTKYRRSLDQVTCCI